MTSIRRKTRSTLGVLATVVVAVITAVPVFAYPRPGKTTRASIGPDGAQGNFDAIRPAISADGRFVAFDSISNTLVPGDMNARSDIFVYDRIEGTLEIVSRAADGTQGDGISWNASVSADGRFVAFESRATTLVPGISPDNCTEGIMGSIERPCYDIFVKDRLTGDIERVSVSSSGAEGNHDSTDAAISADGTRVAFTSRASNLVPNDLNGFHDIFVHDRDTGETMRASQSQEGVEANNRSLSGPRALSHTGRYVAFTSQANTLTVGVPEFSQQAYRKDIETGAVEAVSVNDDGIPGNEAAFAASISADGSAVAFGSSSSNLAPHQETSNDQVYVRDLAQGVTQRVSLSNTGHAADDFSERGVLSPDGRFVSFSSWAMNLSSGRDARWAGVFVYDRLSGAVEQVSLTADGRTPPLGAGFGSIAVDGSAVAFHSASSAIDPGDTNDRSDIYVRDRGPLIGILDGPHASVSDDRIAVVGDAVFSGVVIASSGDAADDGQPGAAPSGTELTGLDIVYRPELEDLHLVVRAHRVEGPLAPDSRGNVYGISFETSGTRYEVRSSREHDVTHGRHALFECAPVCVELETIEGSIGESGNQVRVTLPLTTIGASEGDDFSAIRAFAGRGTAATGVLVEQDGVTVADAAIPVATVEVGIAPAGTPSDDVAYPVVAELDDARFSAELPADGWGSGDNEVWARACLADICGAAAAPIATTSDPDASPSPTPTTGATASPTPTVNTTSSPTSTPTQTASTPAGGASTSPPPQSSSPPASPSAEGSSSPPAEEPTSPAEQLARGTARATIDSSRLITGFRRPFDLVGTASGDTGCAPETVTILVRRAGTQRYRTLAEDVAVATDGTFTHDVRARVTADYVAQPDAPRGCKPAASSPIGVRVRAAVTATPARRCRVSGRVRPGHRGTEVLLQRRAAGRWRTVAATELDERSRFRITTDRCRGRHRVLWPGQSVRNLRAADTFRFRGRR